MQKKFKQRLSVQENRNSRRSFQFPSLVAASHQVLNALAVLTSSSGVSNERSKFMELVQKEIDRIQGEMTQKGGACLRFSRKGLEAWRPSELPELSDDYVSKRLQDRVAKLMHKIEEDMDKVDVQIGEKMHICDLDGDGMVST